MNRRGYEGNFWSTGNVPDPDLRLLTQMYAYIKIHSIVHMSVHVIIYKVYLCKKFLKIIFLLICVFFHQF